MALSSHSQHSGLSHPKAAFFLSSNAVFVCFRNCSVVFGKVRNAWYVLAEITEEPRTIYEYILVTEHSQNAKSRKR